MVNRYFQLRQKQTSIRIEFVAGITTFLTMAYIIFANPLILSDTGMDKNALIIVTCLVSGLATLTVGLLANAPIAMAPGMGLNAFFAFLVATGKMSWQTALGVVFLSGILFLIFTLFGLRKKIVEAIPSSLISAIAVGIGLFITFIGLKKLGIVIADEHTLVKAGPIKLEVLIGLFGLIVMLLFEIKKIKGGLVVGIIASTALACLLAKKLGISYQPEPLSFDISPVAFQLDILSALKWSFFATIFTMTFMDMFDSIGTLITCCNEANIVDEQKKIKSLDQLLGIDAAATVFGALFGTSTTTAYIESIAGIEQGGRTGLTSIVTGICFLLAILLVPLVRIVPEYATAPALIMVGLFMIKEVKKIDLANIEQAFPAFIIMVMIALSYSISTGLAFGFISYTIIQLLCGKVKEIKITMWIIFVFSVLFLTIT